MRPERSEPPGPVPDGGGDPVDYAAVFAGLPTAYLVMTGDLVIVDANASYLQVVGRSHAELVGRPVFEAFPPAEDAVDEHGRNPVQVSFERARDTGLPDRLPLVNYDIADPTSGELTRRYWSLISAPILAADGRTALILQRVEDVTDYVEDRQARESERERGLVWQRRVGEVEADLYAQAQELTTSRQAEASANLRLAALAGVALELAQAQTVDELTAIIVDRGLVALGADGGALAVRDEATGLLSLTISAGLGERAQRDYAQVPLHAPLPAAVAASTGQPVLLSDEATTLAFDPVMRTVVDDTGCVAWASLPLLLKDELLGSLTVGWSSAQAFSATEVDLLEGLAAQSAHGLDRIRTRDAERAAAAQAHSMSEALQRSLLTEPPQPPGLQIVVRYRPAAQQAQVGGDWHDAFVGSDGATCLAIGDVAGHDRDAAAAMGQLRNLLRGIAYSVVEPPARVLTALDRALRDLAVGSLATALLARLAQTPEQVGGGLRTLCWSNAGHPPPLLLGRDGQVRLLQTPADLLLGLDPETDRTDHQVDLVAGDTVLLYTDGLVERRGAGIDDGLAWLLDAGRELLGQDPDALCDALLEQVRETAEDDIALLALRVA